MKKFLSFFLAVFLGLLWFFAISRTYMQKDITLLLEAPLPYGCSLSQLQSDLNKELENADNISAVLKDFFEKTGQYHSIQVRCTTSNLCQIEAQRSALLAHTPRGQLLLETPIRLSPNPYAYQSKVLLESPLAPNHEIATLCKNIHKGLFFEKANAVTVQIFADQTVFMTADTPTLSLWFWPIQNSEKKWLELQKEIDKPLTSFVFCDMRYVSGAVCQLKNKKQTSKP